MLPVLIQLRDLCEDAPVNWIIRDPIKCRIDKSVSQSLAWLLKSHRPNGVLQRLVTLSTVMTLQLHLTNSGVHWEKTPIAFTPLSHPSLLYRHSTQNLGCLHLHHRINISHRFHLKYASLDSWLQPFLENVSNLWNSTAYARQYLNKKILFSLRGTEYDLIKLHSGANGLRCQKSRKTDITTRPPLNLVKRFLS